MDLFPLEKYEDLVKHLSAISINGRFNGRDGTEMSGVSSNILKTVLGEYWNTLSDAQQKERIRESKKRLWDGYMLRLKGKFRLLNFGWRYWQKVAAEESIDEEIDYLKKTNSQHQRTSI